jgi:hypothetical protein
MSIGNDNMNTPETDNLARGNHVVPTEWAEQLERERDEAREENGKLRDVAERALENCECGPKCASHYGGYCDCGRTKRSVELRAEVDQIKEGVK